MRAGKGAAGATMTPELVMLAKRASRCPAATSAAIAVTSAAPLRGGAVLGIASTVDRCLQSGAAKGSAQYSWTWQISPKLSLPVSRRAASSLDLSSSKCRRMCLLIVPGNSCGLLAAA